MALSKEVLREIANQLRWRLITLETEAENLREDVYNEYYTPEIKEMSRKAAAECDVEAAKIKGLMALLEGELNEAENT